MVSILKCDTEALWKIAVYKEEPLGIYLALIIGCWLSRYLCRTDK